MIYVALLRGINVGGNNKIEMSRLRSLFESLGCHDVMTYINSGNVIFRDERTNQQLVPLIESAIKREFGIEVRVVLRDKANINKLCQQVSPDWTNDGQQKTDVLFLWPEVDDPSIIEQLTIKPAIDRAIYIDGAVIWNIDRQNATRSGLQKIIGTNHYRRMTVRNVNTLRKLDALMNERY